MPDVLLIANRTCPCPEVLDEVRGRSGIDGHVLVVAPALNTRLRHWVSDTDGAVRAAEERLGQALDWLASADVHAQGSIGDADPLQAIQDALASYPADEIVISTFPPGESHWLEKDLPQRAEEETGLPVMHIVTTYGLPATA